MDSNIFELSKKINNSLKNNNIFVRLNELEKEMENSDEIIALSYAKDMACLKYSDLLKIYDENSKEVKTQLLAVKEAKEKLETNIIVRNYLDTYSKARDLLNIVNNIIFEEFIQKGCH